MKTYSFFDEATGIFSGRVITCIDSMLKGFTRPGEASIVGNYDHLEQRVDIATGQVVDHQPPKPDDTVHTTYTWHTEGKRWVGEATYARRAQTIRDDRDARMRRSDWVALRAIDLVTTMPVAWREYRQALRDIPDQPGFPYSVLWPIEPIA